MPECPDCGSKLPEDGHCRSCGYGKPVAMFKLDHLFLSFLVSRDEFEVLILALSRCTLPGSIVAEVAKRIKDRLETAARPLLDQLDKQ
jgi:hypothetical protein